VAVDGSRSRTLSRPDAQSPVSEVA
jgi:hypothetical protein